MEFIEQPLAAADPGMAEVRLHSVLPVFADESCGVETDVDCGGGCGPCGVGGACRVHDDCGTGVCVAAACIQSDVRSCALSNGTGTESRSASGWAPCVA
ncbi:MAG: hypothetical protein ACK53Y_02860, partial [bacterium]